MAGESFQDLGFDALKKHRALIDAAVGRNEADTRVRAIDTMLFEVLGWEKTEVDTEKYAREAGFSDYAFKQGDGLCLILEAKQEGDTFVLPDKNFGDRPVGFGILETECPKAGKALRQATGYAAAEGARYVAISNGHQWLLALAFVQGQPIENRSVFVFKSIDDVLKRFSRFWDCFSPDGVRSNACGTLLLESRKAPAPPKLSSFISTYPEPANRNDNAESLDVVIDLVWDRLDADEVEETFLRECYVTPGASKDDLREAKELLKQRREIDDLASTSVDPMTALPTLIETFKPEKPIVVLGRVGHGKSTFLRHLRLVEAADSLKKYIQIEIDFLDRPESKEQVSAFVYSQVKSQLRTRYDIDIEEDKLVRAALNWDLNRFRRSAAGKVFAEKPEEYAREELRKILELQTVDHEYLAKIIHHLKQNLGRSVAIFFDNLDRRPPEIQEEAFLRASAIARDWTSLVFVCLRPDTFYQSTHGGILDTVAPKVLAIVPPKTDALLRKRLQYASKIARGQTPLAGRGAASKSVSLHLPNAAAILDCVGESFVRNAKLRYLFESICNGNLRDMLRLVRSTLTSTHFNTEKILNKIDETGDYRVSDHEALRALLFGNSVHFDPAHSIFSNLFDIERADPCEHFSRLLALDYLNRVPQTAPAYGLSRVSAVTQYLCQIGFSHEHASTTIDFLRAKNCCETEFPDQKLTDDNGRIRITALGACHAEYLVTQVEYYDATVVDTPILDAAVRKHIQDVQAIRLRLARGEVFIKYLVSCADQLPDAAAVKFVRAFLDLAQRDIEQIRQRLPPQTPAK